jgi:hypothetical protein
VAPSQEVVAAQLREELEERLHRALFQAARDARANGRILNVLAFEREVVNAGEL